MKRFFPRQHLCRVATTPRNSLSRHELNAEIKLNRTPSLTPLADRGFNNVHCDPMRGTQITSEERSAISAYVGAGIAVLLAVVGIYFFFLTQKEKRKPQLSIQSARAERHRFERPVKG